MKVKRCPICLGELLSADSICPQCGKIYCSYSSNAKVFIYDRGLKKNIQTNAEIYVTDFFFAHDKSSAGSLGETVGGAIGPIGAVIGGLVDDAISAAKSSAKKTSTAVCYYWKDIASVTYPAGPIQTGFFGYSHDPGGYGIDIKLRDGRWFMVGFRFSKDSAKELYQVMNMFHQKSRAAL